MGDAYIAWQWIGHNHKDFLSAENDGKAKTMENANILTLLRSCVIDNGAALCGGIGTITRHFHNHGRLQNAFANNRKHALVCNSIKKIHEE